MKALFTAAAILTVSFSTSTAQAQFDKLFRNVERHVQQQVRQQVPQIGRQIVREVIQGRPVHIPHPPLPTHPVRPCPKPQPIYPVQPLPTPSPAPCPPGSGGQCSIRPSEPVIPGEPVVPAGPALEDLPQIQAGQNVTLEGDFGPTRGAVAVKIDSLLLEAEVTSWAASEVTAKLPHLPIVDAARATVVVLAPQGDIIEAVEVAFVPGQPTTPHQPELPVVSAGQELVLEGDLGSQRGRVQIKVGSLNMLATVLEWNSSETTVRMPRMSIQEPVPAELMIVRSNGRVADKLDVMFSPAQPQVTQR